MRLLPPWPECQQQYTFIFLLGSPAGTQNHFLILLTTTWALHPAALWLQAGDPLVSAPPRPPAHPTPLLLLIRFPAGVHMNHAPHHAQTQAQVPRHGARLTVLIGVLLQHWWVHRGICRGEEGGVRARALLPGHPLPGPEAPAGQLLPLPPRPACQEAGKKEAG